MAIDVLPKRVAVGMDLDFEPWGVIDDCHRGRCEDGAILQTRIDGGRKLRQSYDAKDMLEICSGLHLD
jgi:hypothetical protein